MAKAKKRVVGIICNSQKKPAVKAAEEISAWLNQRGVEVHTLSDTYKIQKLEEIKNLSQPFNSDMAFCIVLGGDGTFLHAVRVTAPHGIPLLGVNMGRLGFLSETLYDEHFESSLERLLEGEFQVEERLVLEGQVWKGDKLVHRLIACNEVVLGVSISRSLRFDLKIDGEYVNSYLADGMIVSSPTGSTAYSLSAGGPIVNPELNCVILTPICSHSLNARPLVVPQTSKISLTITSAQPKGFITVDGQPGLSIDAGDEVVVTRAPLSARHIRLAPYDFYKILRTKLHWGKER